MLISNTHLSSHRRRLHELLKQLKQQAFFCAYADPLIQGVASETFRRCGKKNCKCVNAANKHGPYLVVQIYEDKKQRQVSLNRKQKALWEQVKNYQTQMQNLLALKKTCSILVEEIEKILQQRLVKWRDVSCQKKK
jgi:hypothetical protein